MSSVHGQRSFWSLFRLPSKAERMERRLAKIGHQRTDWSTNQSLPINWRYQHPVPHFVPCVLPLRQQTGAMTPIPRVPGNTDGIQRVTTGHTPIPDAPKVPRARDRYALEKIPIDELPTVPDASQLVQNALKALRPWQPPAIQFWTGPDADFAENEWLNEAARRQVPPVLRPISNDDPASGDKLAVSAPVEQQSAFDEFTALASQSADDKTAKVPAYMQQRAKRLLQQLKESE